MRHKACGMVVARDNLAKIPRFARESRFPSALIQHRFSLTNSL
jgi:hypothetical protein